RRIAACGDDPPGRRARLEPVLFEILLSGNASHPILAIENVVAPTGGIEHGRRGRQLFKAPSGFLATRAVAGGGQDRLTDALKPHLAALACFGELFWLFLIHGDPPIRGSSSTGRGRARSRATLRPERR